MRYEHSNSILLQVDGIWTFVNQPCSYIKKIIFEVWPKSSHNLKFIVNFKNSVPIHLYLHCPFQVISIAYKTIMPMFVSIFSYTYLYLALFYKQLQVSSIKMPEMIYLVIHRIHRTQYYNHHLSIKIFNTSMTVLYLCNWLFVIPDLSKLSGMLSPC